MYEPCIPDNDTELHSVCRPHSTRICASWGSLKLRFCWCGSRQVSASEFRRPDEFHFHSPIPPRLPKSQFPGVRTRNLCNAELPPGCVPYSESCESRRIPRTETFVCLSCPSFRFQAGPRRAFASKLGPDGAASVTGYKPAVSSIVAGSEALGGCAAVHAAAGLVFRMGVEPIRPISSAYFGQRLGLRNHAWTFRVRLGITTSIRRIHRPASQGNQAK